MAVYVDTKNGFSIGAAADSETVSDYTLPSNVQTLIATRSIVVSEAPSAAENSTIRMRLSGSDWNLGSAECLVAGGYSKLGAISGTGVPEAEPWVYWNLPVGSISNGTISVGGELFDGVAGGLTLQVDFLYSTIPINSTPINRKVATDTATGTSSGASLTLAGASEVVEIVGAILPTTIAGDDPFLGTLELNSSSFAEQQTCSTSLRASSIEGSTSGVSYSPLQKTNVSIPVQPGKTNSVSITSRLSTTDALGTAGTYTYSVAYTPTSL